MPSTEELIKQATEKLQKAQKEQFENLEPEVLDKLKKGLGVAELTDKFEKANGEVAEVIGDLKALKDQQAKEKEEAEKASGELKDRLAEFERKFGADFAGGRKGGPSLGQRFIKAVGEDEEAWRKAQKDGRTEKHAMEAGDYLDPRFLKAYTKAISGDEDSAGVLQDSLRVPGVVTPPDTTFTVQDLLPRQTVENRTVDWVQETGYTNAAAPVAESTATSGGTAHEKPESDIELDAKSETMKTIATHVAASVQILRYSNRTQLRNYIDTRLRFFVNHVFEQQIIAGDGTGNNLNGLLAQAAQYNRGYADIQGEGPSKIDTLRRAHTQARLAEFPVTGQVLHPTDWEGITLTKGSDLHYVFAQPGQVTSPRIWGVPVAESTDLTAGEFLTGGFSMGAELYIGMELMIEATRYHKDYFSKNLVAILAEMDALLAVYRPEAFVTGPFAQPTT